MHQGPLLCYTIAGLWFFQWFVLSEVGNKNIDEAGEENIKIFRLQLLLWIFG